MSKKHTNKYIFVVVVVGSFLCTLMEAAVVLIIMTKCTALPYHYFLKVMNLTLKSIFCICKETIWTCPVTICQSLDYQVISTISQALSFS